ncbi:unnamed protein product [Hymenolepis diminuta]|uniref:Nucleolar protein 12 n=1 Tax=Hymenolepis diminuta TaxID=6216 RepID=A0A0R3S8Q8_HYMDI|nr:unnamed protein product [Hymenolepis diminuta]VUZ55762.1 unnamed protein product [Hymenolepis diminuta]
MGKKKKLFITFDEEKRKDYLTGFRKRKQERRERARVENESQLKEEIRNVKQAYRDKFMEKLSEIQLPNFLADDFNVVSKRTTTDTGGHTVSVEEIDIAQSQYFMGPKNENTEISSKPVINDAVPLKKALKMEPKVAKWKKKKVNKKNAPYGSNQRRKNLRNAQKLKRKK